MLLCSCSSNVNLSKLITIIAAFVVTKYLLSNFLMNSGEGCNSNVLQILSSLFSMQILFSEHIKIFSSFSLLSIKILCGL